MADHPLYFVISPLFCPYMPVHMDVLCQQQSNNLFCVGPCLSVAQHLFFVVAVRPLEVTGTLPNSLAAFDTDCRSLIRTTRVG
jgi:hypothetical protein